MEYKLNKGAKHLTVLSKADAERMQKDGWGLWDEKQEKFIFTGDQKLNEALAKIGELETQLAAAEAKESESSTEELDKEIALLKGQMAEVAKVLKAKNHDEIMDKLSKVIEAAKKFAESQKANAQNQGQEQGQ